MLRDTLHDLGARLVVVVVVEQREEPRSLQTTVSDAELPVMTTELGNTSKGAESRAAGRQVQMSEQQAEQVKRRYKYVIFMCLQLDISLVLLTTHVRINLSQKGFIRFYFYNHMFSDIRIFNVVISIIKEIINVLLSATN